MFIAFTVTFNVVITFSRDTVCISKFMRWKGTDTAPPYKAHNGFVYLKDPILGYVLPILK